MATTEEIMRSMPERFRPEMAGNMKVTYLFELSGEDGGQWHIRIEGGNCTVDSGPITDPDATVSMVAADFIGINTGAINAASLFWSGQIEVEGDMDSVIALAPVMGWQ